MGEHKRLEWVKEKVIFGLSVEPQLFDELLDDHGAQATIVNFLDGGGVYFDVCYSFFNTPLNLTNLSNYVLFSKFVSSLLLCRRGDAKLSAFLCSATDYSS